MKQILNSIVLAMAIAVCSATFACAQKEKEEKKTATRQDSAVASTYLFVIRDPVLHRELRLTRKQVDSIREVTDEIDGPLWSTRNKSLKEGTRVLLKLVVQVEDKISEILPPSKRARLKQIVLQVQGPKAILSSSVAEELDLTDEQISEIQKTVDETAKSLVDNQKQLLAAKTTSARTSLHKKADRIRSDQKKTILSHLSRTQRSEWTSLIGKPVDTSKIGTDLTFKAPEFIETGSWVNSKPLKLSDLKGQVVAVHFYAFQ